MATGWSQLDDLQAQDDDTRLTPRESAVFAVCVLVYLAVVVVGAWWLLAAVVDGWT